MNKFYLLILTILLAGNFPSSAAQRTWTNGPGTNQNWTTAGNWSGGVAPVAGDTIIFNTNGAITFSTLPGTVTYSSITISAGTVTLAGANMTFTISTNLTIANGASLTLTNASITLSNNATGSISGTLTVGGGRTFSTNNPGVLTTVNGSLINSGTVTSTNTARLSFAAGSTYQHSQDGGTIPIATWNLTSLCYITGVTGNAPTNLDNNTFGNVTWNCANQTWNGPGNFYNNGFTILGTLTVQNTNFTAGGGEFRFGGVTPQVNYIGKDFIITGGEVKISGQNGRTVTVAGNFSISGTASLLMDDANTNAILNIAGNFSHLGNSKIYETGSATGSVINFNGTGTQTYIKATTATNVEIVNYAILSGATVDFGTNVLNGTGNQGKFTLNAGGSIITANAAGLNANGTNTGTIQLTGTRTYSSLANYTFNGTVVQNTGNFNTSPTGNSVAKLTISNTAGNGTTGVTLTQPLSVSNSLIFTNGVLTTTSTNILTLNAAATVSGYGSTISGGTTDRFVNGPMKRVGNNTNNYSFTFPVGAVTGGVSYYNPIAVSGVNGLAADTLLAQYFHTPGGGGNNTAINNNNHTTPAVAFTSYVEYWNLTMTTASKNANLTAKVSLYFPHYAYGYSSVFDKGFGALRVTQFTSGQWKDYYNTAASASIPVTSNDDINNFITSSDPVTTFGLFTFGSTGPSAAPLPIELKKFEAIKNSSFNSLQWEANCIGKQLSFELQRSTDNISYKTISSITADKVRCGQPFNYNDFYTGQNKVYYRLKVTDENGKIAYSPYRLITYVNGKQLEIINAGPNPATDHIVVNVSTPSAGNLNMRIIDISGRVYKYQAAQLRVGSNQIQVNVNNLSSGTYILSCILNNQETISSRFVKN
ncbi:MAG: T9SS type A sorting domain-containing protein [Sphingobacteriales bacterium]|nr:MAG: T9SS type A sorting domain-containing protein [Sphingobacteriales bacterium]